MAAASTIHGAYMPVYQSYPPQAYGPWVVAGYFLAQPNSFVCSQHLENQGASQSQVSPAIANPPEFGVDVTSATPASAPVASPSNEVPEATTQQDAVWDNVMDQLDDSIGYSSGGFCETVNNGTWLEVVLNDGSLHKVKGWALEALDKMDNVIVTKVRADKQDKWGLKVRLTIASLPDGVTKNDICTEFSKCSRCRRGDRCPYYHPRVDETTCEWHKLGERLMTSPACKRQIAVKKSEASQR